MQETERARIAENAQTQRERIQARTVGVVVGIVAAAMVGLAFAAARLFGGRSAPPVPPQIMAAAAALLAEDTARRVEVVDGEWQVVDDARQELYPLAVQATAQAWDTTPWTDVRPLSRRGSQETAVFDLEHHEILTPEQARARNG